MLILVAKSILKKFQNVKWLLNILYYEKMNVVLMFRTWAHLWKDSSIQVHCDNSAVVSVLNTGTSTAPPFGCLCQDSLAYQSAL